MPRLTERRRQDRRTQIADAAMRCFARQGFATTSMADIITESGLSAGSIYSHFQSKAELVRFASAESMRSAFEGLASDLDASTGVLAPSALLRHLLTTVAAQRDRIGLLMQIWVECDRDEELSAVARENIGRIHARLQSLLAPWARDNAGGEAPETSTVTSDMADVLIAVLQGFMLRLMLDPTLDAESLIERLSSALDPQ